MTPVEAKWSADQVKELLDVHVAYQQQLRDADQRAIEIALSAQQAKDTDSRTASGDLIARFFAVAALVLTAVGLVVVALTHQ